MVKNKTKEELIELVEELEGKIEKLENDVDYWQEGYDDLEVKLDEARCELENVGVKDINNFIWRLKLDELYTKELEEFINNYVEVYNVRS